MSLRWTEQGNLIIYRRISLQEIRNYVELDSGPAPDRGKPCHHPDQKILKDDSTSGKLSFKVEGKILKSCWISVLNCAMP